LAISKGRKDDIVAQVVQRAKTSKALFVTEYKGLKVKDLDILRSKLRETDAEFHIIKNTLAQLALKEAGIEFSKEAFEGSTAICFAFNDVQTSAKVVLDAAKGSEFFKVKGGILDNRPINEAGVKALADLPPLPVMRAQLLGVLSAPASKLVRTLAEPARQIAAVIKAYAEPAAEQPAAT
jgi:large subunit ribosomal protein L10